MSNFFNTWTIPSILAMVMIGFLFTGWLLLVVFRFIYLIRFTIADAVRFLTAHFDLIDGEIEMSAPGPFWVIIKEVGPLFREGTRDEFQWFLYERLDGGEDVFVSQSAGEGSPWECARAACKAARHAVVCRRGAQT